MSLIDIDFGSCSWHSAVLHSVTSVSSVFWLAIECGRYVGLCVEFLLYLSGYSSQKFSVIDFAEFKIAKKVHGLRPLMRGTVNRAAFALGLTIYDIYDDNSGQATSILVAAM